MKRLLALSSCVVVLASSAVASAAVRGSGADGSAAIPSGVDWAGTQIATVVAAGLLGPSATAFRPDEPLTRAELHDAIVALGKPHAAPTDPERIVTIRELDAQLVAALGLLPSARAIRLGAQEAGLEPKDSLGTETMARLLGLRGDHPQVAEALELGPNEPATRAEAAYSFARALALTQSQLDAAATVVDAFTFPKLGDWQRAVLGRALRFVGFPYVFAGLSEKAQKLWSTTGLVDAPAGFDCSGFVWRVFKLESFDGAPLLGGVLQGRTTYAMSAEVPKTQRLGVDQLEPGDLAFFGSRGTKSKPTEIGHMGIYVGNGWLVHSSSNGVALRPMDGWYLDRFAWGRRPLAEAGLTA